MGVCEEDFLRLPSLILLLNSEWVHLAAKSVQAVITALLPIGCLLFSWGKFGGERRWGYVIVNTNKNMVHGVEGECREKMLKET